MIWKVSGSTKTKQEIWRRKSKEEVFVGWNWEAERKEKRLTEDIDSLVKSADNLAEKAESTESVSFVTQSNSLRRTSKEQTSELQNLSVEKEMEQKLVALKTC